MTPAPTPSVLNVAGYLFTPLHDLPALRERLLASAERGGLKGTVLLAEEGINLVLAGTPAPLRDWLAMLRSDARLAGLRTHESWSTAQPFGRLHVKIKREIIRMNQPAVRPQDGRAAAVDPATLRRWLQAGRCDEGRPLLLLDTRNAWEVDAGAFDGALDWRLARFSDFPAALQVHRAELAGKTVVSYCTGGIRCEKAALWMAAAGVDHVRQLDGGILGYLASAAAAASEAAPAWHGRCVVFDERGALDASLAAAEA